MTTEAQIDAAVDVAMQFLPEFPENLREMLVAVIEAAAAAPQDVCSARVELAQAVEKLALQAMKAGRYEDADVGRGGALHRHGRRPAGAMIVTDAQIDEFCKWLSWAGIHRNLLRDVAREVLEACDAAAWQPIETAPESPKMPRTWVLFWDGIEVCIGYVEPDEGDGFGTQYVGQDGELIEPCLYGSSQNKPTHWRPLPEPPR